MERYLLYDVDVVTWLRKTHNILGVLIGTLPQFPQQNVFLGLPLELQPEEARLLVEMELAYIVDDLRWHETGLQKMTAAQKETFMTDLARRGKEAGKAVDKKRNMWKEKNLQWIQDANQNCRDEAQETHETPETGVGPTAKGEHEGRLVFSLPLDPDASPSKSSSGEQFSWSITPTASDPPLLFPPVDPTAKLPTVRPSSYALFKHLHSLSYFLSPGLRFGCHFLVYPGDPLRFHSHFLAMAVDWDEEIDLMDLVGGGRLGTGVKKGWLIGGVDEGEDTQEVVGDDDRFESIDMKLAGFRSPTVRTFCIEWGGM